MARECRGASRNRPLRKLARAIVRDLGRDVGPEEMDALVTSLVRQWVTCDGHATLFLVGSEIHVHLIHRPDDQYRLTTTQDPGNRVMCLLAELDVDEQHLPDILRQLNIGQSAEFTTQQGLALRFWVNPTNQAFGIEPKEPGGAAQDLLGRMARAHVYYMFGNSVDGEYVQALAASLLRQWHTHGGCAVLLTADDTCLFRLTAQPQGGGCVQTDQYRGGLSALLQAHNLETDQSAWTLRSLNLNQAADIIDRQGVPYRLRLDPQSRRVHVGSLPFAPLSFLVGFLPR
jgi:hypothetical protein